VCPPVLTSRDNVTAVDGTGEHKAAYISVVAWQDHADISRYYCKCNPRKWNDPMLVSACH